MDHHQQHQLQHQNQNQQDMPASGEKHVCKKKQPALVGAVDQGTSSTRFLVFAAQTGELVAHHQVEINKIIPKEGWVEIDPIAIMDSVYATIDKVEQKLCAIDIDIQESIKCIGICNQRESTVVWDPLTGRPYYNVIVWMDNRTKNIVDEMIDAAPGRDFNCYKSKTGLPMSTYFSAFKLKWLFSNVESVRQAAKDNRLMFGTVDTWIMWNLTGKHLTDVTNASRTFLLDIETLEWDKSLCKYLGVPMKILPEIRSSADDFGTILHGPLKGLPITGVIGDQSGALIGQNCLSLGQTKATFGTGCFIMQNIGPGPAHGAMKGISPEAKRGLITTVGYKLGNKPACYALEGSVKIAGAAVTWLRDNMELISQYEECDELVNKTSNSSGVFFVPALGGLYSPYWDPNAAGMFIGLSQFTRKEHIVRATFDSIAFQTNDILSVMRGVTSGLMIDGGLCKSGNMCQILADITGCDIVRPSMTETSALGAAMVAGYQAGIWELEADSPSGSSGAPYHPENHYPPEGHLSKLDCSATNYLNAHTSVCPRCSGSASDHTITTTTNDNNNNNNNNNMDDAYHKRQQVIGEAGGGDHGGGSRTIKDFSQLANGFRETYKKQEKLIRPDRSHAHAHLHHNASNGYCNSSGYSSDDGGLDTTSYSANQSTSVIGTQVEDQCEDSSMYNGGSMSSHRDSPDQAELDSEVNQPNEDGTTNSTRTHLMSRRNSFIDHCQSFPECISSCIKSYVCPDVLSKNKLVKGVDLFQSYISSEHRTELVTTWDRAVERSMKWTKIHHEELRLIDYQRLSSLPISMYLFFSVGMIALSGMIRAGI